MNLTRVERDMHKGKNGRLQQVAINNIIKYGEILGADELCPVTKATIFCGWRPYLKKLGFEDFKEQFSIMNMCSDELLDFDRVAEGCACQTCVEAFDPEMTDKLGISAKDAAINKKYTDAALKAGVHIVASCTPYLLGWLPMRGEHFVTSESHVVVLCNSVFGACANGDGIEAGFWSAICGRTPKWGMHLPENRFGNGAVKISCRADTITDWDLIGYTLGGLMPLRGIPVLTGDFTMPDILKLKQCFAAMATTSDVELCHIVGLTPEAPTLEDALGPNKPDWTIELTDAMIAKAKRYICQKQSGSVEFVSLGCPHYSIDEIKNVADYIRGKKIAPGVNLQVWTSYPIKSMADMCGYTKAIQEAGGEIYSRDCPLGSLGFSDHLVKGVSGMAFDSSKQAHYMLSTVSSDINVFYGTPAACIDAAVSGKWG